MHVLFVHSKDKSFLIFIICYATSVHKGQRKRAKNEVVNKNNENDMGNIVCNVHENLKSNSDKRVFWQL